MTRPITVKAAARLYREITGRRISARRLTEALLHFRHLAHWRYEGSQPNLSGVNKARFEYFVRQRKADRGIDNIFYSED